MSLSAPTSLQIPNALVRAGCVNEFNNSVLLVDTINGVIRQIDMATLTRIEPYCPLSNVTPIGIAMMSSASAIVCFSGLNTIDLVELSGGYKTTHGVANSLPNESQTQARGQKIATDPINKIAAIISSSTSLNMFNAINYTNYTPANFTIKANTQLSTVIYKEPNRFLIGTTAGEIYEIDQFGSILKRMELANPNTNGNNLTIMNPRIIAMSYDNNLLLVSTEPGLLYQIDWSTLTQLNMINSNCASQGYLLSNSASGTCLGSLSPQLANNKVMIELDFTVGTGVAVGKAPLLLPSNKQIIDLGINRVTGKGWIVQQFQDTFISNTTPIVASLTLVDVIPRDTVTRPFVFQNNGVHITARLILIDLSTSRVLLDTYAQSPGTYRVPTGKDVLELVKVGDGATALWDVSRYTT